MLGQLTAPNNLCLLRLSAIGDVCHAVAMVQKIQQTWPQTRITWVIGKIEANLLEGLDNVEFVIFDKKSIVVSKVSNGSPPLSPTPLNPYFLIYSI